MSLILNKWRVYCNTDSKYEYVWLDETQPSPTTCPVNTSHSINASLNRIVELRNPSVVEVKEETTPTGGHYAIKSIVISAPANQITTHIESFPIPVNVLAAHLNLSADNFDDEISWSVAPNTTIGAITANVAIGATVINVSSTVVNNIQIGFYAKLDDGVNVNDLGRVKTVDKIALTITVETATTNAFSAATPTYVKMAITYVKNLVMGPPHLLGVGTAKIGASYLPASVPVVCEYNNKSLTVAKKLYAYIEYLY